MYHILIKDLTTLERRKGVINAPVNDKINHYLTRDGCLIKLMGAAAAQKESYGTLPKGSGISMKAEKLSRY